MKVKFCYMEICCILTRREAAIILGTKTGLIQVTWLKCSAATAVDVFTTGKSTAFRIRNALVWLKLAVTLKPKNAFSIMYLCSQLILVPRSLRYTPKRWQKIIKTYLLSRFHQTPDSWERNCATSFLE